MVQHERIDLQQVMNEQKTFDQGRRGIGMDRAEAQNRRDQDEESPSGMGMDEHINTYSTEL